MKLVIGVLALGLGGMAGSAVAQAAAEPLKAPQAGTTDKGKPAWATLTIMAQNDHHRFDDPAAPMRESSPLGTAQQWFPATSPVIKAFLADPAKPFSASLKFRLTSSGAIAACTFTRPPETPLTEDQLGEAVKRSITFRPALDRSGKPVESEGGLWISSMVDRWSGSDTAPNLINGPLYAPPAPPPPPSPPKLTAFPPSTEWVGRYVGGATWKRAPDTAAVPAGIALAGIQIGSKKSGLPGCHLVAPSGNAALDAAACRFAEKTLKPQWSDTTPPREQMAALLVGGEGKTMSAWSARKDAARSVRIVDGKAVDLYRRVIALTGPQPDSNWTAFGMVAQVDGRGGVVRCSVSRSSGSDRGDVQSCRTLEQPGWLAPATDVFGRPVENGFFWWGAAEQKRLTGG